MSSVRVRAARVTAAVSAGSSLDEALTRESAELAAADRSLLRAITYGVIRDYRALEWLLGRLLDKPLRNEPLLQSLLLCGIHQLRAMRVPPHAAVAETVAAATALDKPWAKAMVNAVLRRYQREQTWLEAALPDDPAVRWSCPDWLVESVRQDWPEHWLAVLAAGSEQGPLILRVNRRMVTREAYLDELAAAGIGATAVAYSATAVRLTEAVAVEQIPGFAEGRVSVQDAAAQFAAELLDARPGQRVLDACAAPGGKTVHLLEYSDELDLLALDNDHERLPKVRQNLERAGLAATLIAADARMPSSWWDGRGFERILLDAPCSGTGVIRRHPDIKWLRRETDIPRMARQQLQLLQAPWPLLLPGGQLLYATCSILRAEGEDVLGKFLAAHADAVEFPIDATWGEACSIGRRLPPRDDFDGFYYARLKKQAAPGP